MTSQLILPEPIRAVIRGTGRVAIRSGKTVEGKIPIPFSSRSFIPDDSMIYNGWPMTPEIWVRAATSVTSDGTFINLDRPDPYSAPLVGMVRFIASSQNYNEISGIWNPYYSDLVDYYWTSLTTMFLEDITYIIGKELVTRKALRFLPGSRMNSMFNSGNDQSQNFGLAMTLILHAPGNYPIFSVPDPNVSGDSLVVISVSDVITLSVKDPNTKITTIYYLPMLKNPLSIIPLYLFFLYTTEGITLYVGNSMYSMTTLTVSFYHPGVLPMKFIIGANNLMTPTGAFQLMDMVIFTPSDLNQVIAMLTTIYGSS